MASIEGFQNSTPIPIHAAVLVTPPTLWWCTIHQDLCLPLNFLTITPTEINTAALSMLIPPPHNCLEKLGLPDTKPQKSCKFLSLLAWLVGNHSALLNLPFCRNFLNLSGAQFFNTCYPSDGKKISHVGQSSSTTTQIWENRRGPWVTLRSLNLPKSGRVLKDLPITALRVLLTLWYYSSCHDDGLT